MRQFSRQIKDYVSQKLKDENYGTVDIGLENTIIEAVLDGRPWPPRWKKMRFDPGNELTDTVDLIHEAFADEKWGLRCDDTDGIYVAWVKDEEYSVFSHEPTRALLLAVWNRWRLEHDGCSE